MRTLRSDNHARWLRTAAWLVATLVAGAAAAQDAGTTPLRQGGFWQTDIEIAKEAVAQLEADLERATLEEWKEEAAAWVEVAAENGEDGPLLVVPSSFRVSSLEADKAEVDVDDPYDPEPRWEIRYARKVPPDLTLVLTDTQGTRISCPLRVPLETTSRAYLGVFVLEQAVHCIPRPEAAG